MPMKKKSLSEQRPKTKQQKAKAWKRSKSNPVTRAGEDPPSPAATSVSATTTRDKQQASFTFQVPKGKKDDPIVLSEEDEGVTNSRQSDKSKSKSKGKTTTIPAETNKMDDKQDAENIPPPLTESDPEPTTTELPPDPITMTPLPAAPTTTITGWQDLLSKISDPTTKGNETETSPQDRLTWIYSANPTISVAESPILPSRQSPRGQKRSRARSSSPTAAAAAGEAASSSAPATPAVGRRSTTARRNSISEATPLKTPLGVDPTLELWGRFAQIPGVELDTGTTSPSGLTNPLLKHLMMPSSPRPARDGDGEESGRGAGLGLGSGSSGEKDKERPLRKSVSCGSHWPKRRKLDHLHFHPRSAGDRRSGRLGGLEGSPSANRKTSLVTELLETLGSEVNRSEEAMKKEAEQQQQQQQQRSSREQEETSLTKKMRMTLSGTRKGGEAEEGEEEKEEERWADGHEPSSPTRRTAGAMVNANSSSGQSQGDSTGSARGEEEAHDDPGIERVSDYGDDFFDEDTLMELDAGLPKPGEEDMTLVAVSDPMQQDDARPGNSSPSPAPQKTKVAPASQKIAAPAALVSKEEEEEEDEFGDLDDDIFDGAEDFLAKAESKPVPAPAPVPLNSKQTTDADDDDDDDAYGDDFGGDFDFDAAELAATQSAGRAGPSASSSLLRPQPQPQPQFQPHVPSSSSQQNSNKPRAIQRYLVTNVLESSYTDDNGREVPEKILVVQAERTNSMRTIHLRGDWYETQAHTKSYVHVIGQFEGSACVVDNAQGLIILHPDQLISSTVVADSFSCMRRAVLQDRVKATSDASPALVYGTLLHEIFQAALLANRWEAEFLAALVDRTLDAHVEDLYVIKVGRGDARDHLLSKMPELRSWAAAFVAARPRAEAVVQGRNGERVTMCVSKLLDVEEHVWSPMYGLKGNIDATVQVTMREGGITTSTNNINNKNNNSNNNNNNSNRQQETTFRTLTVPFEVKTGKNVSAGHQAQTVLYNLLLSDRYDVEVAYGVLYYMETSQTLRIPAVRHELRHMVMQRNQLACHARERSAQLPPMKRSRNACARCYAQTACFTYHRLADGGDGETSGLGDAFDAAVRHLTPAHRDFFLKWEDLLTKEEKEGQKLRRELWTMTGPEREKRGRCFAGVVIEEGSAAEDLRRPKINRFSYTFVKADDAGTAFSFLDSQLTVGEPIVVSDEQGHFALALGYVTAVRRRRISVAVDRRLHNARIRQPGFDEATNQVFASIMSVEPGQSSSSSSHHNVREAHNTQNTQSNAVVPPVRYRLDKDEFSNGMATVRNNLVQVMADGPFGSREIRRLVVDLVPPRFSDPEAAASQLAAALADRGQGPEKQPQKQKQQLNVDQRRAIEKVLTARDYALVLGMPGTGKTHTIAHIIRALVAQGRSVLLTSYTHTAVDNILLKLRGDDGEGCFPVLRLGAPAKVHPAVRDFAILAADLTNSSSNNNTNANANGDGVGIGTTFEAIRAAWHDTPVVATTCLGIGHPVFAERTFDYCIVDEASQITLPVCLGPIRAARTFVLVGDHNQLPPLVQNEEARAGGLDVSLFKLLSDAHPQSVATLEHQYRMCEDVMALSNTLIYDGRLRCGTEALRRAKLNVPRIEALQRLHYDAAAFVHAHSHSHSHNNNGNKQAVVCPGPRQGTCWLRDLLDPEARVRFVDTDALLPHSREEAKGARIVNACEAQIIAQLVDALLVSGVPAADIGVVTHYRSQLALLKHNLTSSSHAHSSTQVVEGVSGAGDVEMHTADRFQGRDKEVVLLSLVRSNEACAIGDLLRDWRRVNVAFTRAKTKLLVVGSRSTLRGSGDDEMLARFVRLMEDRDWVYELPSGALDGHLFSAAYPSASSSSWGASATQAQTQTQTQMGGNTSGAQIATTKRQGSKVGTATGAAAGAGAKSGPKRLPGKENARPEPKRARIGERALLKGKPVLRDILNDMTDGMF